MNKGLLRVSLRQNAIVVPTHFIKNGTNKELDASSSMLLANCTKLGFNFSENLLQSVNGMTPIAKLDILELLKEVTGVNKNWTPLVKQWNIPTGENYLDHVFTLFANVFRNHMGTRLSCGHLIPNNTFPLERYNGCPFCGTPFKFDSLDYNPEKNKLKTLELWTESDLQKYLTSLLESPVALDATQVDSLTILLKHVEIPVGVDIKMKETLMVVVDTFVDADQPEMANMFFKTPNDILRYLWFKHTGYLQIVEPKTLLKRMAQNASHRYAPLDKSLVTKFRSKAELKLKFNRTQCKQYANWINNLPMGIEAQCENMHPKRGIWIRVIRALRLAEYSKKKGYENLAELLDVFYNEVYETWQGRLNRFKLKSDAENTFKLLQERPGLFARSLFSTMLWFGPDGTIKRFKEVIDKVPSRLIFTLNMYAEIYFDRHAARTVKPLGGNSKRIPVNRFLQLYPDSELLRMQKLVRDLSLDVIGKKLSETPNFNSTMYIDEGLLKVPISIGDRAESVQDTAGALMGTRFDVEGDKVRLFLQWGEGLPAQHLDMDLSCKVAYENRMEFCSYSQLVIRGCKHSGDIQRIPNKVGTAEYIDINISELEAAGAKYVSFTCNAFTTGSIAPNLVVGWMNSFYKMRVSSNGVAYDPTQVQHQIRIKKTLTKGMVFGVLDIQKRQIIWLEMAFGGQVVQNMDFRTVEGLIQKLDAKLKIGDLLRLKAKMQGLKIVNLSAAADEVYDMDWALNTAEVSKLFLD